MRLNVSSRDHKFLLGAIAINAYWINLDNRKDRASYCISQLSKIGMKAIRVSAITRSEVGIVENTQNQDYFQGVIACRMSHMKALSAFLSSGHEFGLILEDDFLFLERLKVSELSNIRDLMKVMDIQLLQIGFLPKGISLPAFFSIPISKFSKLLGSLRLLLKHNFASRQITHGFLPGAHAYIVNREMALYLLKNAQLDVKVPVDLWLSALAREKNTDSSLISRLRFSIVSQNRHFSSDIQL